MQLEQLKSIVNGQLSGDNLEIDGLSIDSRASLTKRCFVAIQGERFDGHDFIADAASKGAVAVLVSKAGTYPMPSILVKDTTEALGAIAAAHRAQFSLPILALTGSCGKTTVKEMLASLLPKPSFATRGNLNNHLGVPLSLLALNSSHRYGVFELGANHQGEIKRLVDWVKPTVALITNIAPAHLEGFGSIEGVASAKAEIFFGLDSEGVALINLDDERIVAKARNLSQRQMSYSIDKSEASVHASQISINSEGMANFRLHFEGQETTVSLQVPGRHNVSNAVAAAAGAYVLGVAIDDICAGLKAYTGFSGRLSMKVGLGGARIIDDSYNANLSSVKVAIDTLMHHQGLRVLVLGELAEVGVSLNEHYETIGLYAKQQGIDRLFTCGSHSETASSSFGASGKHFESQKALLDYMTPILTDETSVLVKGSRSAHMEQVVTALLPLPQ